MIIKDIVISASGLTIIYILYDLIKKCVNKNDTTSTVFFGFILYFVFMIYILCLIAVYSPSTLM